MVPWCTQIIYSSRSRQLLFQNYKVYLCWTSSDRECILVKPPIINFGCKNEDRLYYHQITTSPRCQGIKFNLLTFLEFLQRERLKIYPNEAQIFTGIGMSIDPGPGLWQLSPIINSSVCCNMSWATDSILQTSVRKHFKLFSLFFIYQKKTIAYKAHSELEKRVLRILRNPNFFRLSTISFLFSAKFLPNLSKF